MTSAEKAETYEMLKNLADLYTGAVTERKISAYTDYLADIPFETVKKAILRAPGKFTTFPSAGTLRGFCGVNDGSSAGGVPGWRQTEEFLHKMYDHPADLEQAEAMVRGVLCGETVDKVTPREEARERLHDIFEQLRMKFGDEADDAGWLDPEEF